MGRKALPTVQIGRANLGVKTVKFNEGDTVADALKKARLSLKDGEEIRKNCGEDANRKTELAEGDVFMLIPPVEGGIV